MLHGNESISYYSKGNIIVWMMMAFQAGVLNVGGFLACHRFVSHVTGFATFFGVELSKDSLIHASGMLAVPAFFLLGSMISGQLVDVPLRAKKKPRYPVAFGLIFLFILMALIGGMLGIFGAFGGTLDRRGYILLAILCLVCGLQNATVSTVSQSVIRTTHLTGLTTDLGVGLMRVLNARILPKLHHEEVKANLMRAGIILFFFLGSIAGAFTFSSFAFAGFVLPALISGTLFLTMIYFQVLKKRSSAKDNIQ